MSMSIKLILIDRVTVQAVDVIEGDQFVIEGDKFVIEGDKFVIEGNPFYPFYPLYPLYQKPFHNGLQVWAC